ncbi:PTS sugar transporter subunit IIB, partial [Clostridioides difficile]|nr:PTS sugar transporter subunit IIB [Clostridioides difficile]
MEKFMSFMDKYIVPVAAKIGAQRHLVAVRDAFIVMIPIT